MGPMVLTWSFLCRANSRAPVKERYMGGRGQSCDSHVDAHLLYSQVLTRSGKGTKE